MGLPPRSNACETAWNANRATAANRLHSLKDCGVCCSRDIHLEPELPFCDIVSQVGCPNGSLSFPLGFSICPTDIQIGWVGVQMNVTRTIFPYLGHPERAGEQPPGFPKSPHLKLQSAFCDSHFSAKERNLKLAGKCRDLRTFC